MKKRLADFIRAEIEPILQDWEAYAETIFHAEHLYRADLRDHAREMLLSMADDLDSNKREPELGKESWAQVHGIDRLTSGFSVTETVSEFRALRTNVVSHWTKANTTLSGDQLEDLTRFNEAIDQAISESLEHYTTAKEMETRLFGAVLTASPDPIFVLDLEGRFSYANQATVDLISLEADAVIGQSMFDLGFPFASDLQSKLRRVISDQSTCRGKLTHRFASGPGERFEYLLAPVVDEHENTEAIVCIFRDTTEQARAEELVWHNAHHDHLTGLPNRRLFLDRLEQEVKHSKRSGIPIAVFFMDLDGFKEINDLFGHEAGDRLLLAVAERLSDCVREEDTVARMGGDEFTILVTAARQRKDIELLAETVKDAIEMPFEIAERSVHITVSIGISFYPYDATSSDALLEAADRAMYKTKKATSHQVD